MGSYSTRYIYFYNDCFYEISYGISITRIYSTVPKCLTSRNKNNKLVSNYIYIINQDKIKKYKQLRVRSMSFENISLYGSCMLFDKGNKLYYYFAFGNETFYPDERYLITYAQIGEINIIFDINKEAINTIQ